MDDSPEQPDYHHVLMCATHSDFPTVVSAE